ncbi:hypothetical protein [Desulfosarcina sp.]|uniref:hypothetical protein n=1 Tax=Desulfosarcina sp. TaxID=2027861 RepID=UPI003970FA5C
MVTVDPDKPILKATELKTTAGRIETRRDEFGSVFREAMASAQVKGIELESTPVMSEIRPARFSAEMPPPTRTVDRVQQLIDTMDAYQQKLGASEATLKDIQTLVRKMTVQHDSLTAVSNDLGEQENLGTIVNHSLMLASMEIAKFNSGYYNDQ